MLIKWDGAHIKMCSFIKDLLKSHITTNIVNPNIIYLMQNLKAFPYNE